MEFLIREKLSLDGVRCQNRLIKTGQDQFQFIFISGNVAYSINSLNICLTGKRIDGNVVFVETKAPLSKRTKISGQTEKRQKHISLKNFLFIVVGKHTYTRQFFIMSLQ